MSDQGCYLNSKKVLQVVQQEYAQQCGEDVPEEYGMVLQALVYTRYSSHEVKVTADQTSGEESMLADFVAWFLKNDEIYRAEQTED